MTNKRKNKGGPDESDEQLDEQQDKRAWPGILSIIMFSILVSFPSWYMGFSQRAKLGEELIKSSPIAREALMFRKTVTPSFWGFELQLTYAGQPLYTLGELQAMQRVKDKARAQWKRALNQQRKMLDEHINGLEEGEASLRVVEVAPPPSEVLDLGVLPNGERLQLHGP